MPYATEGLLIDRFGEPMLVQLTDRGETATGAIDSAVVARALADTDAVIDGYLAGRYKLPLAAVPQIIVDLALSISIYKLHVYDPSDKIRNDYKDALKALSDIAAGVIRIPAEGREPAGTGGTGARVTDRERPFTERSMKGFI